MKTLPMLCAVVVGSLFLSACQREQPVVEGAEASAARAPETRSLSVPISQPWAVAVRPGDGESPAVMAAISHQDNYLKLFEFDGRQPREVFSTPTGYHPDFVRWLDFDGDGRRDELLVIVEGEPLVKLGRYHQGEFSWQGQFPMTDEPPREAAVGDLDGDGHQDIVLSPYWGGEVFILWNKGEFDFELEALNGGFLVSFPSLADLDGDGRLDVVWSNREGGAVVVAYNRGERQFDIESVVYPPLGASTSTRRVHLGDLNGDGKPDLIAAFENTPQVWILYNVDGDFEVQREELPVPATPGYSEAVFDPATGLLALSEPNGVWLGRREGEDQTWVFRRLLDRVWMLDLQFQDIDNDGEQDLTMARTMGEEVKIVYGPLWEYATPVEAPSPEQGGDAERAGS
ncbi:MAG: FG-GAP repeat domain-containing protein [Candidatus Competibacterales bacterium]